MSIDPRLVFIVQGQNTAMADELSKFLAHLGLKSLQWTDSLDLVEGAKKTNFDVVREAITQSQAVIILSTPDEWAYLREGLSREGVIDPPGLQPRPNVLFEAGFAYALKPEQTIRVRVGTQRDKLSDVDGIQRIDLNNTEDSRRKLIDALRAAKCPIPEDLPARYADKVIAGDFELKVPADSPPLRGSIIEGHGTILDRGSTLLKSRSHNTLQIFAPTGVWIDSEPKRRWFETIATCLENQARKEKPDFSRRRTYTPDRTIGTTLTSFTGIFGIPPQNGGFDQNSNSWNDQRKRRLFKAELGTMRQLLSVFDRLPNARLYYLDIEGIS